MRFVDGFGSASVCKFYSLVDTAHLLGLHIVTVRSRLSLLVDTRQELVAPLELLDLAVELLMGHTTRAVGIGQLELHLLERLVHKVFLLLARIHVARVGYSYTTDRRQVLIVCRVFSCA